jgi:tRNA (adenine57-N1/adenine58-N1)-methyltransferase
VPGGILLAYVPTVPQAQQTVDALRGTGMFALVETVEVLLRPWNIDGRSVRPAHRMVAHTGFLVTARRVREGSGSLPGQAPAVDAEDGEDDPDGQAP